MPSPDLQLLAFPDADAFEAWLADQPATVAGAWLTFGKPGAPEATLSKSDAIDSALAYGWIDGQLGRVDAHYYKVRFTPRKARSVWSQVNRERVERLIAEGRMKLQGLAEVSRAKADGRWDAAYAPQGRATPDPDLAAALDAQPDARRFFDSLDAANRFAVLYRVQQAKGPEKRAAKVAEIVARLASGEAFHPIHKHRASPSVDALSLRPLRVVAAAAFGRSPPARPSPRGPLSGGDRMFPVNWREARLALALARPSW